MMKRRTSSIAAMIMVLAFCAVATLSAAKPAWGPHSGPGDKKKPLGNKPSGHNDLVDGDIDFDALSPKDCATYLCVSEADLATKYIESGCPGPFAMWERGAEVEEMQMHEMLVEEPASYEGSGGVTTVTLLALASASGVFAAGVGFVAGYKSSPSFAYMRIPSLV